MNAHTIVWWAPRAWLPGGWAEGVLLQADARGHWSAITPGVPTPPEGAQCLSGPVLPGLVNAHSHAFHRGLRGWTQRERGSFWTWRERMYAVSRRLTPENYRTLARAEALAAEVGGSARPFEELHALLAQADVVVCSTASPVPLFTHENVAAVGKARRFRPLFMVDLAVPRDIAPEVGSLDWVHAYDVDDIQKFVADNAAARAEEAQKAGVLVAQEVARFVRERAVRQGVPVLAQLRQRGEAIARAEVERTLSALGDSLDDKQRKSIEAMARAIVNKLLHEPTAKLRAVGPETEGNRLAGAAAELFGLQEGAVPNKSTPNVLPNVLVGGGKG